MKGGRVSLRRARREGRGKRSASPRPSRAVGRWKVGLAVGVVVIAGAVGGSVLATRGGPSSRAASSEGAAPAAPPGAPVVLRGIDPVTGKPVSLAPFRGKSIVLNVWASWCTGCAAEARALGQFARAHPEAQVIGIDVQDSKSGAKAFYRRFGWRHPSIFDPSGTLAVLLGAQGLPTTFFLDRQHRIVAKAVGETSLAGFAAGLREATT